MGEVLLEENQIYEEHVINFFNLLHVLCCMISKFIMLKLKLNGNKYQYSILVTNYTMKLMIKLLNEFYDSKIKA